MSNTKDLLEFAAILQAEFPEMPAHLLAAVADHLIRLGKRHYRLCEDFCNWMQEDEYQAKSEKLEAVFVKLSQESFGGRLQYHFQGDPRGCTVKLVVPSGRTNDFGREGVCVPGA